MFETQKVRRHDKFRKEMTLIFHISFPCMTFHTMPLPCDDDIFFLNLTLTNILSRSIYGCHMSKFITRNAHMVDTVY